MTSNLTLAQIRVFAAVEKHMSVSRAAAELNVSQPYISGQIAALEARLGVVLFNRVGRRVRLNEAGRLFAPCAARVLEALRDSERALDDFRGLITGRLMIAASSTPGAYLLPLLLRRFLDDHPGIELALQIKDKLQVEAAVLNQDAELGVVAEPPIAAELSYEVVGYDELVLVAGARHHLAGRTVGLAALAHERLLVRERTSGTRMLVEEQLTSAGVQPQARLELSNTDAIKEAAAAGLGVAFISERAVQHDVASGRLVVVPLSASRIRRSLCLLTVSGHKPSPPAAVLRNLIVAELMQTSLQRPLSDSNHPHNSRP